MKAKPSVVLAVVLLVSLFCPILLAQGQGKKGEVDKVRSAADALADAYDRLDVEKILSLYAEDATYLIEDAEMLRGKEAIRKYFSQELPEKVEFKRDVVELKVEGELAYEIVNQVVTLQMKGQPPQTIPNKYIHVWKKQKNGSWKLLIDMFNRRTKPT
jgi:uncharacterized protein (TIGR02246 family)